MARQLCDYLEARGRQIEVVQYAISTVVLEMSSNVGKPSDKRKRYDVWNRMQIQ